MSITRPTSYNYSPLFTITMAKLLQSAFYLVIIAVSSVAARQVNITYLDNCVGEDSHTATVFLRDVVYHILEDGSCDIVHSRVDIQTVDADPYELVMTLYKCEQSNMKEPCLDNPTVHEEMLNCDRLMNDASGPWHMFTSAMEGGQCGDVVGIFEMSFARLKLEHLIKYLDVYDANFNTFRLKMYFKSTLTQQLRGCGELDFTLS